MLGYPPGSTRRACSSQAVRRDIVSGCDVIVLNRFAKLEAQRQGLMSAFAAAAEANVPVLTSVSPAFQEAWERFASPLFVTLPAELETIDGCGGPSERALCGNDTTCDGTPTTR